MSRRQAGRRAGDRRTRSGGRWSSTSGAAGPGNAGDRGDAGGSARSVRRSPANAPSGRRSTSGQRSTSVDGSERRSNGRRDPLNRSPSTGRGKRSNDRGSSTVWTVGGIGVVTAVLTGLLWFAAVVVTRHRAQSAADLAALAAASKAVAGEDRACDAARWVAEQMEVALRSCRLSGWDALVEVVEPPPIELVPFGSAAARARAGPIEGGQ